LDTVVGMIGDMAKRRRPPDPVPEPPDDAPGESSGDRHLSTFMLRLDDVYRVQLRRMQQKIRSEQGFRVSMTSLAERALESMLREAGLWPPPVPPSGPSAS
jgi:hypothetical protein